MHFYPLYLNVLKNNVRNFMDSNYHRADFLRIFNISCPKTGSSQVEGDVLEKKNKLRQRKDNVTAVKNKLLEAGIS